jgi:hypothetical protein
VIDESKLQTKKLQVTSVCEKYDFFSGDKAGSGAIGTYAGCLG